MIAFIGKLLRSLRWVRKRTRACDHKQVLPRFGQDAFETDRSIIVVPAMPPVPTIIPTVRVPVIVITIIIRTVVIRSWIVIISRIVRVTAVVRSIIPRPTPKSDAETLRFRLVWCCSH